MTFLRGLKFNSKNITLAILFVAIILPIGVFTFIQLKNLQEHEELLKGVQQRQLQTVIFSINQHSDDVMKSLLLRLENIADIPALTYDDILPKYPGLREVAIVRDGLDSALCLSGTDLISRDEIAEVLDMYHNELQRLRSYKDLGYSKLEPLATFHAASGNYNLLAFIIKDLEDQQSVCLLFIEPVTFIEQFIAPKMQELAEESYVIAAAEHASGELVYATDSTDNEGLQSLPLWLLPDYDVNVTLQGKSAAEISQNRFRLNLIWIMILTAILVLGFVVIVRNLRREMQLTQLKSDFVSSVSHEIRTPLALINMFAETLLLGRVREEEKKQEYYEIITKETSRLKNIVNKILNFSQLETKKRIYRFETARVDEVVKDTLDIYSYHLGNNGFEYTVSYGAGSTAASIDSEAVTEALINLIDNAMKYSGEQKRLDISTGIEDDEVYVSVKDYGIGISDKDQKMIFDKFFRVTQGDIYYVRGAGLGLSITKSIMDAHAGRIALFSTPDEGSEFQLLFPIVDVPAVISPVET